MRISAKYSTECSRQAVCVLAKDHRMKTVSRRHYALSVCAATAMLAGCDGSAQSPSPSTQTSIRSPGTAKRATSPSFATPERNGSDSSGKETLTAQRVVGDCRYNELPYCNFETRGNRKARGPFPGYFRAGVSYNPSPPASGWSLGERFFIKSGSSKIEGSIYASGSGDGPLYPVCTSTRRPMGIRAR